MQKTFPVIVSTSSRQLTTGCSKLLYFVERAS